MLADRDCPAICAFRSVMAYIFAAKRIGGDLIAGYPLRQKGAGTVSLRSPYDGEPAKRSAGGRAAELLHDVSLSSGRTDASELPLSPEFENDFAACAGRD